GGERRGGGGWGGCGGGGGGGARAGGGVGPPGGGGPAGRGPRFPRPAGWGRGKTADATGTRLSRMSRPDGRSPGQLREIRMTRGWLEHAEGSVLVEFGATRVLCAASATEEVPRWRRGSGLGWVTAEYAMRPRATDTRGDRA